MSNESADRTFSITELAREFGITTRTIRYYEDQGLLAPARAGQVRVYGRRERTRLKLALRGKRLGLSLAEIRELIELYDTDPDESVQLQQFLAALSRRKAALEQQREDIEAVLSEICEFERQCRALLDDPAGIGDEAGAPRRRPAGPQRAAG
jgi:DNA-binding transcriptional MerR regulator